MFGQLNLLVRARLPILPYDYVFAEIFLISASSEVLALHFPRQSFIHCFLIIPVIVDKAIKDVDGAHSQIECCSLLLHPPLNSLVEFVRFAFSSLQELFDFLLGHCAAIGLEYCTGSKLQHILHFVSAQSSILLTGHTALLDDQTIPLQFDGLPFNNLFLHCGFSN